MNEFEDYYNILGISENASPEDVKKAYRDQCFILHPDRLAGAPESARTRAEEMLKRINRAFDVLSDPAKRHHYDSEWQQRSSVGQQAAYAKPKPVVEPQSIRFANVEPGEIKTATFTIRNEGGPCSRIWFNTPDSWLKVVSWVSVTDSNELPLQVHIEATGDSWGKIYTESIKVKLDDEQAEVRVELRTKPERGKTSSGSISKSRPASAGVHCASSSNQSTVKWATGLVCCAMLVGIAVLFWQAPKAHTVTATQPAAIQTHRRALPSAIHDGDWIPDGSGIVASSQSQTPDGHSRYRLYITGADGTDKRQLDIGRAAPNTASEDYVAPLVSPDGKRIAFVLDRHDHPAAIYTVSPDGTNVRMIAGWWSSVAFAWYSNEAIAYWRSMYSYKGFNAGLLSSPGKGTIHLVDVNSGATQLINNPPQQLFTGKFVCISEPSFGGDTIVDLLQYQRIK